MKPIDQTRFHGEDGPGNCYAACLASVLELSLEDVPWPAERDRESWGGSGGYWEVISKWLTRRGLFVLEIERKSRTEEARPRDLFPIWTTHALQDKPLRYIASGPGPRGVDHCCVYLDHELEHDPHPSREGLLEITSIEFLVPLEVASVLESPQAKPDTDRPPSGV